MAQTLTTKLARAALLAALALPTTALLSSVSPLTAIEARADVLTEHKQVLAQYGTFQQHAKYGEVWIPSVTPQGWHPYQPCHWVYTKYGWYFDDKTPWGNIVHHYGRWTHEAGTGWMWVAGQEFSPGWVVWKANQEWVGWAPMPPDQDVQTLDAASFNTDKMWTFMETAKFGKSCDNVVAPVSQVPVLLQQTSYIKNVTFVDGIAVFVFPTWLIGPVININIVNINIWSPVFIVHVVNIWNIVWNINIINIACALPPPAVSPASNPPPPPPGRRAETPKPPSFNPPSHNPPSYNPVPPRPGFNPTPPGRPGIVVDRIPDPQRPGGIRPLDPGFGRPNHPTRPIDPGIGNGRPGGQVGTGPRPIDPGFGRPNGHPTRPIDPGIGNGRPGGQIGTGPRPIDPGFGKKPSFGTVGQPQRPVVTHVPRPVQSGVLTAKPKVTLNPVLRGANTLPPRRG
jgi:hypothetical protein